MELRSIQAGENIVAYSAGLAHTLFAGVTRDTGLPYTHDHLAKVAEQTSSLLIDSETKEAGESGAWLHDAAEDIESLEVLDPFVDPTPPRRQDDVTYLNDLLVQAGDTGELVCFIVDGMTHRDDINYQGYVLNLFDFTKGGDLWIPKVVRGIVKSSDRRKNLDPDEEPNINALVKEYVGMEGASQVELEAFYRRTKTLRAFKKAGEKGMNAALFARTLERNFRVRQIATATDNLAQYLPLMERKLLVEVGERNEVFDWARVREMLKGMYLDSLRIVPWEEGLMVTEKMGINRKAPKPANGYTPILHEIREEIEYGGVDLSRK